MYNPFSKGSLLKKKPILAYYSTITPIFPSPPKPSLSPQRGKKEEKKPTIYTRGRTQTNKTIK